MARMRSTLVAATATIAALAAPTTAAAVTTTCDGLQQALDSSTPNSTVTLDYDRVCVGSFHLPSHAITFEGAGDGATLGGDHELQILRGDSVGATTIKNLTFIDGFAGEGDGGAIDIDGNSPVTLEGNHFFDNEAEDDGGAVNLELDNLSLTATVARGDAQPVVLRGNEFGGKDHGNLADDEGGGVFISAFFRAVVVEDNTFTDNVADNDDGGGLEIDAANTATLDGNTFTRNESGDNGGGASVNVCSADITSNVFDSNRLIEDDTSLVGGGLFLSGDVCSNDFSDFARGAPAPTTQADNRFLRNTISGEFSNGRGGGEAIEDIEVVSTGDRFVDNSITGTDSGVGGGLAYDGSSSTPLKARNLVAAGNLVAPDEQEPPSRGFGGSSQGGGLFLAGNGRDSEFSIEDSTVVDNTAAAGSGIAGAFQGGKALTRGEQFQSDVLVLANSIVHGNNTTGDDIPEFGLDGEINGFFARDVRSSDVCVDGAAHEDGDGAEPNSNICEDPQLQAPDGKGGVDQKRTSPTLDAGDDSLVDSDLTKDYAGDGRVLDGDEDGTARVDMGADEFKVVTAEPTPTGTTQPPAAQPPQGAVQGATKRSCVSRRAFRIRIRVPRGKKARSAVVRVNNKKVKVVRGKRLRAPVRLRGLPKGRFTVKITVRLTNGKKITGKRIYHTCIPKLPGDGPPRV